MTQPMTDLDKLAERWEDDAKSVREIEANYDYSNYWRGYATALDQCARTIRARSLVGNTGETGRSSTDGEGAR